MHGRQEEARALTFSRLLMLLSACSTLSVDRACAALSTTLRPEPVPAISLTACTCEFVSEICRFIISTGPQLPSVKRPIRHNWLQIRAMATTSVTDLHEGRGVCLELHAGRDEGAHAEQVEHHARACTLHGTLSHFQGQ